ncbi:MAG: hypothetical protein BWY42_00895 [Candidatus Omnitrophica bacterium ADurb.Bin277]|nr:MAG: hypothetical protein BWY42_00895 [Candidatus Omnitrophica bacterium ADurb.Bin277]
MRKRSPAFGTKPSKPSLIASLACAILLGTFCLAFTFSLADQKKNETSKVRKAAAAGTFYPAEKNRLASYVDEMLRQADAPGIPGTIQTIIVPHAGYVYSGHVAAHAYKMIRDRDIRTVILMCNSHRHGLNGIAVYKEGSFETPLGKIEIDRDKTMALLAEDPRIMDRGEIHEGDHVLEVQLPFLQRTLGDFKIVPLLFGTNDPALSGTLAEALEKIADDKTLLIASTDMSHYPSYTEATAADRKTIDAILTGDPGILDSRIVELESGGIPNADTFMCGLSGVRTAMILAQRKGASDIRLLKYANSGDVSGDKRRVVGYASMVFLKPVSADTPRSAPGADQSEGLNEAEQAELLRLAKNTVETYVKTRKIPSYTPALKTLEKPAGAFVTLREHGRLRGCIGRFEPNVPLYSVIQQMAVAAAAQDPRFPPVEEAELQKLDYEISVLSPLHKVPDASGIIPGKHGVEIRKGLFHRGVFLPQVATETGWGKEKFLSELCSQKAGLPGDCWKDPSVDLYVFTAQVFPEEKK